MAINPTSIASKNIQEATVFAIEMLSSEPVEGQVLTTSRPPGQMLAWFNGSISRFQLYIVNGAGNRLYRVVS